MSMVTLEQWQDRVTTAFESHGETNSIDFKFDLSDDNERLKEHINAFGNFRGGGIFVFGVTSDFKVDQSRCNHETIIHRIMNLARDCQLPPLQVVVHHLQLNGEKILSLEVLEGTRLPVFIKGRDPWTEGAFIRSGNSTRNMAESEIRDVMAQSRGVRLDSEPLDIDIELLDRNALETYLGPFKADQGFTGNNLAVLIDNKAAARLGARHVPTVGGWLMFAQNPQQVRSYRNASIEFQQFSGRTRENPVRKLEIVGSLPQQVTIATGSVLQNIWKIPRMTGIRRQDIPSYDETTLREVITNAVVHRDYHQLHQPVKIAMFDDRIEFENPGGLLPGLNTLNLLNRRAWRNETIANLMLKAGLGEMDGQGIDRIYGAITRLKIPAPSIQANERTFKIVLSAPKSYEEYSPEEKRLTVIVQLMLSHEIDNGTVRATFGIDMSKASNLLKELVEEEIIRRKTKSMKFAKYCLTEKYQHLTSG